MAEENYWGTVFFVDYFLLARIEGSWKIVCNPVGVQATGCRSPASQALRLQGCEVGTRLRKPPLMPETCSL